MDDISQTIGRVRRAMPRNVDVMTICDELEQRLVCGSPVDRPAILNQRSVVAAQAKPKLTRAQIQRNYRMRKKVEKAK